MARSQKTVLSPACDGGGSSEVARAAAKAGRKQTRPGTGGKDKQNPNDQRSRKIIGIFDDGGAKVRDWVAGKRSTYK
ncbi:MAG: hypothetical protein ACREHV_14460 [Rhizomicrobium sp.]